MIRIKNKFTCQYFFSLLCLLWGIGTNPLKGQESPLSGSNVLKIKVLERGVYRISAQDLQNAGWNLSQITPQNLALFGSENGMLPQENAFWTLEKLQHTLKEQAIQVVGGEDGRFEGQDYLLFFAESSDKMSYNTQTKLFEYEKNLYDDHNYYFLVQKTSPALRIEKAAQPQNSGTLLTQYDRIWHHELELANILSSGVRFAPGGSGRKWFGERFDFERSYRLDFEATSLIAESPLHLRLRVMALSGSPSNFNIRLNNKDLGAIDVPFLPISTYAPKGVEVEKSYLIAPAELNERELLRVEIEYNKTDNLNGFGYLDYLTLQGKCLLQRGTNQLIFRNTQTLNLSEATFQIQNLQDQDQIWDISDPQKPIFIEQRSGNAVSIFTENKLKEFVVFQNPLAPLEIQSVESQNLIGLPTPNFLILTHPNFEAQAQRLADFRRAESGLEVQVVRIDQVYHEFSSGRQDVSGIRNFIRYLYLKNPTKMQYVLLFGDASFDYKDRIGSNTNFIPTYQARESLHPILSFCSDDYFAFMDENEGFWEESYSADEPDLDLGIGRLPVRNAQMAELVVDKLLHYGSMPTLGDWRKRLTFVSDDGDQNIHSADTERLTNFVESTYPAFNVQKVHVDAFAQVSTSNGKESFAAREQLEEILNAGTLLVNFMGHGSETGWTSERILTLSSISRWQNQDRLPLFVTATCTFGRYDNPNVVSGGEQLMVGRSTGAIGLVTSTRPVFSNTNYLLARAFYEAVLEPIAGEMPRLGQVMRKAKNQSLNLANRNFALIGDPSMRLAYTSEKALVTKIERNGVAQNLQNAQIAALSRVRVSGQIEKNGALSQDFNGTLFVKVFEKPASLLSKGDESDPFSFPSYEYAIFQGQASVRNGLFSFEFIVPKDIDYKLDWGKISLYAQHDSQNRDALGHQKVLIGGSDEAATPDNAPPKVQLWVQNRNFKSGDVVPSNTLLLADLEDEQGINISGYTIGHDIEAVLELNFEQAEKAQTQTFILNAYYQTLKDDFTKGTLNYALQRLPAGKHRLSLTAWDTHNNFTTESIEFRVENAPIAVDLKKSYPNPFSDRLHFEITQDRAGDDIELILQIFDVQGRLVRQIRQTYLNSNSQLQITWDGKSEGGTEVRSGAYICKIIVSSPTQNAAGQAIFKAIRE
ncbi:type IX secretion system sortase PorU [Hugenholtzia roseola]|uniref:type IX secretion system sortase PorU n=1 Tax=Hugenholtzia roseola TaxID=1002 RepID=UPI00040AD181|nr:type IX secretion system sortase PorU [Hugenholtzia roseola]